MTRPRPADPVGRPLYARILCLRHLAPSGLLCFVFLEGAVVLGVLLALAELVSWWGVLVLPFTVALMVKFNDLVAGASTPPPVAGEAASARVSVLRPAAMPPDPAAARPGSSATYRASDRAGCLRSSTAPHTHPTEVSGRDVSQLSGLRGSLFADSQSPETGAAGSWVPDGSLSGTGLPDRSASGARVSEVAFSGHRDRPGTSSGSSFGHDDEPGIPSEPFAGPADGVEADVSGRRTEEFERPGGFAPVVSRDPSAMGYGPVAMPDFVTDGYRLAGVTEVPVISGTTYVSAEGRPYAAATSHPYRTTDRHPYENPGLSGVQVPAHPGGYPAATGRETRPAVGNASSGRPWTEQVDVREQMSRQAAARRYE